MTKWEFDLNKQHKEVNEPFGYCKTIGEMDQIQNNEKIQKEMLEKKIQATATQGKEQVLMALFMNYMIGNTLNIFVIFFTFQNVYNPLKNLFMLLNSMKEKEFNYQLIK
ncbi:WGR domain protein [Ichthyophthirius multifiliis]|uniref:ER membrane protein complex subunit 4 n=1 Tax=Ichthyophthirius multifiliis TaxID=5932 RepID=G0QJ80_ICHMU|nr:WGR domain protein [Ichthyophthirius multifiliis]EGR34731.1 WGR domain protein [Ichthyophthirius multifiliis]|eukprot:XP_004040035.1 WGR domain protein [Ichthyophthirius multifiliis]